MKIKISEATPIRLDYLVAKIEGMTGKWIDDDMYGNRIERPYSPSTDWAQGGPIIERERINVRDEVGQWAAWMWDSTRCDDVSYYGPTPLIAAVRCFVSSRLGDEVEVPEEL